MVHVILKASSRWFERLHIAHRAQALDDGSNLARRLDAMNLPVEAIEVQRLMDWLAWLVQPSAVNSRPEPPKTQISYSDLFGAQQSDERAVQDTPSPPHGRAQAQRSDNNPEFVYRSRKAGPPPPSPPPSAPCDSHPRGGSARAKSSSACFPARIPAAPTGGVDKLKADMSKTQQLLMHADMRMAGLNPPQKNPCTAAHQTDPAEAPRVRNTAARRSRSPTVAQTASSECGAVRPKPHQEEEERGAQSPGTPPKPAIRRSLTPHTRPPASSGKWQPSVAWSNEFTHEAALSPPELEAAPTNQPRASPASVLGKAELLRRRIEYKSPVRRRARSGPWKPAAEWVQPGEQEQVQQQEVIATDVPERAPECTKPSRKTARRRVLKSVRWAEELEQVGLDSEDEFEDTPAEEGEWCEQFDELAEFDEFCEFDELDDLGSECDVEHEELQCRGFEGSYTSASSDELTRESVDSDASWGNQRCALRDTDLSEDEGCEGECGEGDGSEFGDTEELIMNYDSQAFVPSEHFSTTDTFNDFEDSQDTVLC
eukprot:TRINITY_DN2507_c0_g1_i2.p1 TRINITY_DN2507_c0_g1~~TRINITY_DN2507_c0_g1_i2.p1  ORF type:complete len:541 (-),score=74.36 TRINITY_DN2507_c0_g1_i2:136-1758(-)